MFQQRLEFKSLYRAIEVWKTHSLNMYLMEIHSVWNQKTLKRRKVLFFKGTQAMLQFDSFNLALLQGACSQETPSGCVG